MKHFFRIFWNAGFLSVWNEKDNEELPEHSYTVGRNTYKFRMNNMCNTFFLFEHIIILLENCTGNKDTSFKSWIQPYEKHIDLIEMTIERMDPCSVQ